MPNEPVFLFEILVPTMTNSGVTFKRRTHLAWDANVRKISGGLTVFKPAKGNWISPKGELFIERMIPVRIFCTEKQINEIADMSAKYYKQEAIMFYRLSDSVQIVNYDRKFSRKFTGNARRGG